MARNKTNKPQISAGRSKKTSRPRRDAHEPLAEGRNDVDGEKPANAPEDDESQSNESGNAGKRLFPFKNIIGSQEEEGEVILINLRKPSFETVKRYIGVEEPFKNALSSLEDKDPGKIGSLFYALDPSHIITMVASLKGDRAIELMSAIYGRLGLYDTFVHTGSAAEELQQIFVQMKVADSVRWYTPPSFKEANKTVNLFMPHMEMALEQPSPILTIPPEYKKRRGKLRKFETSSEEEVRNKNDTISEDSLGLAKNLYLCESEESEDEDRKNMLYVAEDSDINNVSPLNSQSADEDADEMLVLYQNNRHILMLLGRKAYYDAPFVLEAADLMLDLKSRFPGIQHQSSEKYPDRDLIIDQKTEPRTWMDDAGADICSSSRLSQDLKQKEPDLGEFDGNSIDKNIPRMKMRQRKNSNDPFLQDEEEERRDDDYGWSNLLPNPLVRLDAKRIRIRSPFSSLLKHTRDGGRSRQELYSSDSEGSNEEDTDSSGGDVVENADSSEICSSSQSSLRLESEENSPQRESEEESGEQCLTCAEDEQPTDDKQRHGDDTPDDKLHSRGENAPGDMLHSHACRAPGESFPEESGAGSQPDASSCTGLADSEETRMNVQAGTEAESARKEQISENGPGVSKHEPKRRGVAAGGTHEEVVEANLPTGDLEADVAASCNSVLLADRLPTTAQRLARGSAVNETRSPPTPPLSTPVQVSSPTASESTITACPNFLYEPVQNGFISTPYERDGTSATIYSENFPSENPQLGSERLPPSAGAGGEGAELHTPVVAEDRCCHVATHPEDDSGPFVTEETMHSFTSRPGARQRQPSVPSDACTAPQFSEREAPPSQNIGQSDFESRRSNPAPLRLPPITVHAAGALPPWATRTARIDLSQAANREFVQLRMRRATYDDDWPDDSGIDPANMALAGFFRRGLYEDSLGWPLSKYCHVKLKTLSGVLPNRSFETEGFALSTCLCGASVYLC